MLTYSFLICIWHCYNNVSNCGKSIDKKYPLNGYSCLRTNRLLSGSSLVVKSIEDTSCDKGDFKLMDNRNYIYDNSGGSKSERDKVKDISLKKERSNMLLKRKKNILNRIDAFFEKKLFNYLGPIDIIKNNLDININTARKTVNRKVDLGISLPYLVFLTGLALFIILLALVALYDTGDAKTTTNVLSNALYYGIPIFLISLAVFNILGFIYISIKIAKYEKVKKNNSKIYYNIVNAFYKKYI
ncbi:PIR Superfamily Protein [Plasmodium malariae]|uniref:PIR Superfamily Protein n=1 Tax=Plasmodium malariae TaxID=5858 RepID=A0A1A8WUH9_PLAMA|nr:PIR Superfamily Protein [Plasmodium malariae]